MANKPLAFWRSCQSPRTGFVHLFDGVPGGDVIPLFENFCFASALFREKTVEAVLEGKSLLERLFAFQTAEGNFPLFLHDYPRAWNRIQPLRIAPLLIFILREFKEVLGEEFQEKVRAALERMFAFVSPQSYDPLWERRAEALLGKESTIPRRVHSSEDLREELITAELLGQSDDFARELIHPVLGVYTGPFLQEAQERSEPKSLSFSLPVKESASLRSFDLGEWKIRQTESDVVTFAPSLGFRWMWRGENRLHSLAIYGPQEIEEIENGFTALFVLPELLEIPRSDLYEVACFCNLSPETSVSVEGQKATVFSLGQTVSIQTPEKEIRLRFDLIDGEAKFLGHLYRGNRPGQTLKEAYDWKISLRTISRSKQVKISLYIK